MKKNIAANLSARGGWVFWVLIILGGFLVYPPETGAGQEPGPVFKREGYARWKEASPFGLSVSSDLVKEQPFLGNTPPGEPAEVFGINEYTSVVFQSYRDGNWEIYTEPIYDRDIWRPERITNHGASDVRPSLDTPAAHVAFASDRGMEQGLYEIYRAGVDGSDLQRLTNNVAYDSYPVWSPAGTQIAFVSDRDGNAEVYRMNADGSNQARLTFGPAVDVSPTWSPDGSQIAWIRILDDQYGAIYLMNADGTNPHPLTGGLRFLQNVNWSPTGAYLGFDHDGNGDGWNDLGLIHPDGSGLTTVKFGYENYDYWAGGWSVRGDFLFSTQVHYILDRKIYYIEWARLGDYELATGVAGNWMYSNIDFHPQAAARDTSIPESRILPLPEYSRAAGFKVEWDSFDPGPAFIYRIHLLRRLGSSGSWEEWKVRSTYSSGDPWEIYSGDPGTAVYFSSRATDDAGHWEAWPTGNGDAHTRLYSWQLAGQITDGRGLPAVQTTPQLNPAPVNQPLTDLGGKFLAFLLSWDDQTVQAGHDGYGSFPPGSLSLYQDESIALYLPPEEDALQNGGFEEIAPELDHWASSGTYTPTIAAGHSGSQAVVLGLPCGKPCLSTAETIPGASIYSYPNLVVDGLGYTHMIWSHTSYSMRDPQGNWSPVQQLPELGSTNDMEDIKVQMAIGPQNTLHIVMVGERNLYYLKKPQGGPWSTAELFGWGERPDLAVDNTGIVHVVYRCWANCVEGRGVYYQRRLPNGSWLAPVVLGTSDEQPPQVAAGPDGKAHLYYYDNGYYYRTISPTGVLSNIDNVSLEGHPVELIVDGKGTAHLVTSGENDWLYWTRTPQGAWTEPLVVNAKLWAADMDMDNRGGLYVAGVPNNVIDQVDFFYIASGTRTIERMKVPLTFSGVEDLALDIDHRGWIHLAWSDYENLLYKSSNAALAEGRGSLSQAVTLPPGFHKPTLSWMGALYADRPWTQSGYEVRISNGVTETLALASQDPEPWALHWVDMQPWVGQTVTVTFTLDQAAGEPYVHLALDDISLGSWLTPVITSIDPAQVDFPLPSGRVITIRGENFLPGASVRLGQLAVTGVEWIDENTLRFILPDGIKYGSYDVWVINPGGQTAVQMGGLRLGQVLYLPAAINR